MRPDPARPAVIWPDGWRDYALLDSGAGWKLEQVGPYRFARPEPQAFWAPHAPLEDWRFDGRFSPAADEAEEAGRWRLDQPIPEAWPISYKGLKFFARCTPFRHLGFFPEQASQWDFLADRLGPGSRVLNLFGYTGVASLIAAAKGAQVTHVDASKKAIGFARQNQAEAGLETARIRWICDDALGFVRREARRGNTYHAIILDPPKHGRGPDGQIWKLEEGLTPLLAALPAILPPQGGAARSVITTVYAVRLSFLALANAMDDAFGPLGGQIEAGEMALQQADQGRLLPTAIFARWYDGP